MSARLRYERLATDRAPYEERARACARLTIPRLFPHVGANGSTTHATPYQSVGARGVNSLASKLVLAMFPVGSPFFRYVIDDFALEALTQQEGLRGRVEDGLSRMERGVTQDFESEALRSVLTETVKHLLVTGNYLLYTDPATGQCTGHRMDKYVVRRSPSGRVEECILAEQVNLQDLPEAARARLPASEASDRPHTLYTHIKRSGARWAVYQEFQNQRVPGTSGSYAEDECPWQVLRLHAAPGEDYGRSFIEDYIGDLHSLEVLQRAMAQGAAAAAKVLFLVRPGSSTDPRDVSKSESGDVKAGNKEDITVLQLDKYADFQFALNLRNELVQSLSAVFMLTVGLVRNAERVTAEEIRVLIQDLEQGNGGLYSVFSQELQLPLVRIRAARLQRLGRIPYLPKGVVEPQIVAGLEALGRSSDVARLRELAAILAESFGPEVSAKILVAPEFALRVVAGLGIDRKGLVKGAEELEAEQEAEAQREQELAAVGPTINAMAQQAQASQ